MRKHPMKASAFLGRLALLSTLVLSISVVACGNAEEPADGAPRADKEAMALQQSPVESALAQTAPSLTLEKPTTFLRVNLKRDSGGAVASTGQVTTVLGSLAMPSLDAEYLLVGYAGDTVVSAVPVAFPRSATSLGWDGEMRLHSSEELTDSTTSAFLLASPELDHVVLYDGTGNPSLELSASELPELFDFRQGSSQGGSFGQHSEPLSSSELRTKYPHILILTAGDESLIPSKTLGGGSLVEPNDAMNQALDDAFNKLPPLLFNSVQTIAWVSWANNDPNNQLYGVAFGASLLLNAGKYRSTEFAVTVAHEAAHNLTNLTTAALNGDATLDNWPKAAQSAALQLVQRFKLVSGLDVAFEDLHNSGVPLKYTRSYLGTCDAECNGIDKNNKTLTPQEAAASGFASAYAACSACEDLAEYVGVTLSYSSTSRVCELFTRGKPLSADASIPYAKLVLLRGVGAITGDAFEDCVKGTTLSQEAGIRFDDGPSFTSDAKGGPITREQGPTYGVYAEGNNTYKLLIEVALPRPGASPLGLHRLSNIGIFEFGDPGLSGVYLDHSEILRVRSSKSGLVLFTENSKDRTAGAVFGMVFRNSMNIATDAFPFGTFSVP